MTFDGRKITTLVMLALFLVVLVMAYSLPPKAAFMPYLVGIPGALLCLLQLVIDIRQSGQDKPMSNTEKAAKASEGAPEAQMFIWLAIFTGALIGFGFVYGGPIVVMLFVRYSSKDTWRNAMFAGAGTFAVLFGMFIWLLELQLFQGLVVKALF